MDTNNGLITGLNLLVQTCLLCCQIPTLVFLALYVYKTWQMASATRDSAETARKTVQEMKDARDQEAAPNVMAYFDVPFGKDTVYLVIRNFGKSIAQNVQFKFDPPIKTSARFQTQWKFLEDLQTSGLPALPPDYEIRTIIDSFLVLVKSGQPLRRNVSISYYGGISTEQRKTQYTLDLSPFEGILYDPHATTEDRLAQIVEQMEKLHSTQAKTVQAVQELSVLRAAIQQLRPDVFEDIPAASNPPTNEPPYYDLLTKLVRHQAEHNTTRFRFEIARGDDSETLYAFALSGEGEQTEGPEIFNHPNTDPLDLWQKQQYIEVVKRIGEAIINFHLTQAALRLGVMSAPSVPAV